MGIDPGKTTGIVTYYRGAMTADEVHYLQAYNMMVAWSDWMAERNASFVIAIESANTNSNRGGRGALASLGWEIKQIGVAEYAAHKWGHTFLEISKSNAAHGATNEILDALGWRFKGEGHADDAYRIMIQAMKACDLDFWKRLVIDKELLKDREERSGQG